jgi:UDP-N-acetylmuramyl tripeptide synthase
MGVEEKYQTILSDFLEYEFKEKYDVIVLCFTQFSTDHLTFHKKVVSLIKEEGILIGVQYSPKQLINKRFVKKKN